VRVDDANQKGSQQLFLANSLPPVLVAELERRGFSYALVEAPPDIPNQDGYILSWESRAKP